jgi:hypothetical protein
LLDADKTVQEAQAKLDRQKAHIAKLAKADKDREDRLYAKQKAKDDAVAQQRAEWEAAKAAKDAAFAAAMEKTKKLADSGESSTDGKTYPRGIQKPMSGKPKKKLKWVDTAEVSFSVFNKIEYVREAAAEEEEEPAPFAAANLDASSISTPMAGSLRSRGGGGGGGGGSIAEDDGPEPDDDAADNAAINAGMLF